MEPTPNNQQVGKKARKKAGKKVTPDKSTAKKNKATRTPSKISCSKEEMSYLGGQIGEFLDTYIVLGYDLQGNAISMYAAKSQQHVDGLMTLLQNTAADMLDGHHSPSDE